MKNTLIVTIALFACLVVSWTPAHGGEEWDFDLGLYLWGSGLDGDVVIRGIPAEVSASFSDLADNLDIAITGHFEARKDKWGMLFDLYYVRLEQEVVGAVVTSKFKSTITMAEIGGTYEAKEWFDVLFGGRYIKLSNEIKFSVDQLPDIKGDEDWIDPFVGGRFNAPLGERFAFLYRLDLGGFGIGSNFTWNTAAHLQWKIGKGASMLLGYRYLDVNYSSGNGTDRFEYKIAQHGPVLAFIYSW